MASDDHVAAALNDFAKEVIGNSRADLDGGGGLLSREQAEARRHRLHQLATATEAMAASPRTATYQAFERILEQAQELGAQVERETIIRVASAFMLRPYVSPAVRSQSDPNGE
jgi:hypothetical protein